MGVQSQGKSPLQYVRNVRCSFTAHQWCRDWAENASVIGCDINFFKWSFRNALGCIDYEVLVAFDKLVVLVDTGISKSASIKYVSNISFVPRCVISLVGCGQPGSFVDGNAWNLVLKTAMLRITVKSTNLQPLAIRGYAAGNARNLVVWWWTKNCTTVEPRLPTCPTFTLLYKRTMNLASTKWKHFLLM